jgi:uncharacterized membrane protein
MDMSIAGLLGFVVWILIIGGIFWLLWWLIGFVGLPEPFNKVARVVVAIVAVVILINFLLGAAGQTPFIRFR